MTASGVTQFEIQVWDALMQHARRSLALVGQCRLAVERTCEGVGAFVVSSSWIRQKMFKFLRTRTKAVLFVLSYTQSENKHYSQRHLGRDTPTMEDWAAFPGRGQNGEVDCKAF